MKIKIIAAVGKNSEIGKNNDLPAWKLADDMKRFKSMTLNCPIILGRKNYESIPEKFRPLPNRKNIILTRDASYQEKVPVGVKVFTNMGSILENFKDVDTIWILGGGEIYRQFLHLAGELHITHIDGEFEADTFFPEINEKIWEKQSEEKLDKNEKNSHNSVYTIYTKR
jgi:dihydrofolate reductase